MSRVLPSCAMSGRGKRLTIGACVTHAEIEDGKIADVTLGLMPLVASGIAYRAVRNRGTIGGGIWRADPAADWLTTTIALDASLLLSVAAGQREVRVTDFVQGALETDIGEGEIVTRIFIPRLSSAARWGHAKYAKKAGDFAQSIAVAVVDPQRGFAHLVLGQRAEPPKLMSKTSELLVARGCVPPPPNLADHRDGPDGSKSRHRRLDHASCHPYPRRSGFIGMKTVSMRINGEAVSRSVDDRLSLADFVRDHCLLTGTHVGCEQGVCGACTLMLDGRPARSCITLAVAADGSDVRTMKVTVTMILCPTSARHLINATPCNVASARPACWRRRMAFLARPDLDHDRIRNELAGDFSLYRLPANCCFRLSKMCGRGGRNRVRVG